MISILCVFNDRTTVEEMLLPGLKAQTVAWQELFLDNSEGRYASAAEALNELGSRATGDFLMIVHQDVRIDDTRFLEKAEASLRSLEPFGVAGAAGCGPDSDRTKTAILCGTPPRRPGDAIDAPVEVQTVDECLFFIPTEVFRKQEFDAATCDNWHLYAVDYCLALQENLGLRCLVVPFEVYHRSAGVVNAAYFRSLRKVLIKHKKKQKKVFTTVDVWATFWPTFIAFFYRLKFWLYFTVVGQWFVRLRSRIIYKAG